MTNLARTNVATLAQLTVTLARYSEDVDSIVRTESTACARVLSEISAAVQVRARELSAAQEALSACQQDPESDCSHLARQAQRATQRLVQAERAMREARLAVDAHEPSRHRFTSKVGHLTGEGRATLGRLSSAADQYLVSASGDGGEGGGKRASASASTDGQLAGCQAIPGAPDGYALVPLGLIDDADSGVTGPESFGKGYSPDDLRWAHEALHDSVLPALSLGKGKDFFAAWDQDKQLQGSRSLSDTYSGFFGTDAIKLEPGAGAKFTVGNGYHRIWVAKQMGLTHVVARVP